MLIQWLKDGGNVGIHGMSTFTLLVPDGITEFAL
jgi:hypothetical protein